LVAEAISAAMTTSQVMPIAMAKPVNTYGKAPGSNMRQKMARRVEPSDSAASM